MSEKENQEMDGKEKKAAQEENVKDEKIELADDDAEKAAGGRSPMRLGPGFHCRPGTQGPGDYQRLQRPQIPAHVG